MRYSHLFAKTIKTDPREEISINARYLIRGGFIDKLMAGSFTLLPLGFRVVEKIKNIIREEMNSIGGQEILMPLLHPKEIWNETGRWDSAEEVMYKFKKDEKEYALSFTHEEIMLDLVRKHVSSYKDFPVKVYHFSTKFRDEPRAKSGILRGREFIMKDLYSAHTTKEELDSYYWKVAEAYKKVFKRVGFEVRVTEAAGGVFTENHTHEFQAISDVGEDTIYVCEKCEFAENKEVVSIKDADVCPNCSGKIVIKKAIEVGNIFRFGTVYSEKMKVMFQDWDGKRDYPYLGSYGIGITRLMGVAVELFHDDRGIIWPESIAPFNVHLISITNQESQVKNLADEVYKKLQGAGVEVLYDDREDIGTGQKFADADLIGIPVRLVVSSKTGGKVEWKKRDQQQESLISVEEVPKKIRS